VAGLIDMVLSDSSPPKGRFGCRVATDWGKRMREGGMIRFVKMAVFSGVQQAFFIGKAITSGRFSC